MTHAPPPPRRSERLRLGASSHTLSEDKRLDIVHLACVGRVVRLGATLDAATFHAIAAAAQEGRVRAEVLYVQGQARLTGDAALAFVQSLRHMRHLRGINLGELRMGAAAWTALLRELPHTTICHVYLDDGGSLAMTDHPGAAYVARVRDVLLGNQARSGVRRGDPRIAVWADHNTTPGRKGYAEGAGPGEHAEHED